MLARIIHLSYFARSNRGTTQLLNSVILQYRQKVGIGNFVERLRNAHLSSPYTTVIHLLLNFYTSPLRYTNISVIGTSV